MIKKIYLSICIAILTTSVFAQSRMAPEVLQKEVTSYVANVTPTITPSPLSTAPSAAPPIWENDFSDTVDWIFTNTSIPPLDWRIETNSNLQALSVTNLPASLTPFASTTVSNGFLWISSDFVPGNVDGDGTPIVCEATTATPIDLSLWPNVTLSFEHNYRWWNDTRGVRVSGDNGATWTEFQITDVNGYPNDQNSGNPEVTKYDISAVAGGQSQVLIQFYYDDNDIWAWYWAVDDVKISETPDNLITMQEEVIGGWWVGYQTAGGVGLDYSLNPMNQATANPYSFESVVANEGLATQNVTMHVEVTEDATQTSAYTGSSNPITLAGGMQDTLVASTTFTPLNYGAYTIEMWTIGDSAFTDTTFKTTVVTDSVYGRDNSQIDGYYRVGRSCGGMVLGVDFDIFVTDDLTSVSAYVYGFSSNGNNISIPGAIMYGALYEVDPQGDPIWLAQTDDYSIQQGDLDNWVTIPFNVAQILSAGTSYMIAIGGYAHPLDTFAIAVSGDGQGATNHVQDNGCSIGSGSFGDWYWISSIPMIRMNLGTSWTTSSIDETVFEGSLKVYPNPTNGAITINLNNITADNYTLTLSNVLGEEIYSVSTLINGTYKEEIDLSSFGKGAYFINISNSNSSVTERIVVE